MSNTSESKEAIDDYRSEQILSILQHLPYLNSRLNRSSELGVLLLKMFEPPHSKRRAKCSFYRLEASGADLLPPELCLLHRSGS